MSKYVFSCIHSEYNKIRTRKNSVFRHFSHSVSSNSEGGGETSKNQCKGSLHDSSVSDNTEVCGRIKISWTFQHSVQLFPKLRKRNIKILRDIAQTTQGNQIKRTTQVSGIQTGQAKERAGDKKTERKISVLWVKG